MRPQKPRKTPPIPEGLSHGCATAPFTAGNPVSTSIAALSPFSHPANVFKRSSFALPEPFAAKTMREIISVHRATARATRARKGGKGRGESVGIGEPSGFRGAGEPFPVVSLLRRETTGYSWVNRSAVEWPMRTAERLPTTSRGSQTHGNRENPPQPGRGCPTVAPRLPHGCPITAQ